MKKRVLLAISAIALVFALGACAALGLGADTFIGTWNFASESAMNVTITAAQAGMSQQIVANSDNTFTMTTTSNGTTSSVSGTWSKSGSTYTLTAQGSPVSGTVSGNTFTIIEIQSGVSVSLIYTKA